MSLSCQLRGTLLSLPLGALVVGGNLEILSNLLRRSLLPRILRNTLERSKIPDLSFLVPCSPAKQPLYGGPHNGRTCNRRSLRKLAPEPQYRLLLLFLCRRIPANRNTRRLDLREDPFSGLLGNLELLGSASLELAADFLPKRVDEFLGLGLESGGLLHLGLRLFDSCRPRLELLLACHKLRLEVVPSLADLL